MSERRRNRGYRPKSTAEIARNMSAIRSCDNRTEVTLRSELHALGLRFRLHSSALPGRPDIIFPRSKTVVFVDGDYWHGRVLREQGVDDLVAHYTPKQRKYWVPKLQRNVARDEIVTARLEQDGWLVLRFWESDAKRDPAGLAKKIATVVRRRAGGSS